MWDSYFSLPSPPPLKAGTATSQGLLQCSKDSGAKKYGSKTRAPNILQNKIKMIMFDAVSIKGVHPTNFDIIFTMATPPTTSDVFCPI